ncbi:MAG: type II toxin-antitoxin system prevent-host-death family antitoxin [Gemmatimonadota bacterium]|nr:type II toxin-antitoxin system prevent-host-death family antitoxin [Gemmatimonadota bacterium]
MKDNYSLYEAKAKLSAMVQQVFEGQSVTITVHGEPMVELRPYQKPEGTATLHDRVAELTGRGEVVPPGRRLESVAGFPIGKPIPGALQRFLDERD